MLFSIGLLLALLALAGDDSIWLDVRKFKPIIQRGEVSESIGLIRHPAARRKVASSGPRTDLRRMRWDSMACEASAAISRRSPHRATTANL